MNRITITDCNKSEKEIFTYAKSLVDLNAKFLDEEQGYICNFDYHLDIFEQYKFFAMISDFDEFKHHCRNFLSFYNALQDYKNEMQWYLDQCCEDKLESLLESVKENS